MLKERLGFDSIDEEVVGSGVLTFLLVHKLIEKVVEKSGVSFGEFLVLAHLHGRNYEINLNQLKHGLIVFSGASITKIVEKLVDGGFVLRRINPSSRREKLIRATPAGKKLIKKLLGDLKKLSSSIVKGRSTAEKRQMLEMCRRTLSNAVEAAKEI